MPSLEFTETDMPDETHRSPTINMLDLRPTCCGDP